MLIRLHPVHARFHFLQSCNSAILPLMDGLLIIDKPSGPTSHDVVARVAPAAPRAPDRPYRDARSRGKRRAPYRRLGRATRLARFLSSASKDLRSHRPARVRHDDRRRGRRTSRPGLQRTASRSRGRRGRTARLPRHLPAAATRVLGEEDRVENAATCWRADEVGQVRRVGRGRWVRARRELTPMPCPPRPPCLPRPAHRPARPGVRDHPLPRASRGGRRSREAPGRVLGRVLCAVARPGSWRRARDRRHLAGLRRTRSGSATDRRGGAARRSWSSRPELARERLVPMSAMLIGLPVGGALERGRQARGTRADPDRPGLRGRSPRPPTIAGRMALTGRRSSRPFGC